MADSALAILSGPARPAARSVIKDVASSVNRLVEGVAGDCSLASGLAGFAVFRSYLDAVDDRPGGHGEVADILSRAFESCQRADPTSSLFHGMPGIGWAMGLCGRLAGHPLDHGRLDLIDEAIVDEVSGWSWAGDYDLVVGLVGVGVYGLSRLPSPAGTRIVEGVVARLAEGAESTDAGVTWKTPPELLPPDPAIAAPLGYYNLGMAHGIPGVIAFLAQACRARLGGRESRRLLDGAVGWLLAQRLDQPGQSVFPYWVGAGTNIQPARTAWCYGDPGVAVSLLVAAECTGESGWRQEAVALAAVAAARPLDDSHRTDPGLCHGPAGLGHIFNRFHRASGSEKFATASRLRFGRAISQMQARPAAGMPVDEMGFLAGATGVGLALLTATVGIEPVWDAALLISSAAP